MIVENDFKILKEDSCYVLHVLKNKKEIKENNESSFKTYGYFTNILSALKAVLRYRRDKKYPGKESSSDLVKFIKIYKESLDKLDKLANIIYNPIFKLNNGRL